MKQSGRTRVSAHVGVGIDPVCGMEVDPRAGGPRTDHAGHTFVFCSERCLHRFEADPSAYVDEGGRQLVADLRAEGDASVEFTCPMHPEVRQVGAGSCPICGMALEPVTVTADSGPSAELVDMRRRFKLAVALSIPIVLLEMASELVSKVQ